MKAAKIRLFLIIGVIVFTGGLWFFLRQTPLPEIKTVYKTTPVSKPSEIQLPQTQIQGKPHSHDEGTPHTHSHERPSDSMVRLVRESYAKNPHPMQKRWLAYVESEEGRAFFDSFPTTDEWFEKSKSFGFFDSPALQAARDRLYRKFFPTGTVDENESIIRDIMRDAILEYELYKEVEPSQHRNSFVLIDLLGEDKYVAWVEKKFGSEPPSASQEWVNSTFEEIRLAERQKYLALENNETTARINDSTGSERPQSEIELPQGDGQTPANTRDPSENILTVEDIRSDDVTTQQAGIETLAPTVPESPELPTNQDFETALRERFSPERFNRAMKTLNQYGPQEGLRRLKSSDPEVAKQVERLLPKRQEQKE